MPVAFSSTRFPSPISASEDITPLYPIITQLLKRVKEHHLGHVQLA